MRHKHVLGLDLLRLMAVGLVMLYHFAWWNQTVGQPFAGLPGAESLGWGRLFSSGWIGVEIFFVISGYVIAFSSSGAKPLAFLQNRFLRLAPVNWIAATLTLALLLLNRTELSPAHTVLLWAETMVFWPLNAIDGPWWTLGIEIDFYLVTWWLMRTGRGERLETVMFRWGGVSLAFWAAALAASLVLQEASSEPSALLNLLVHKAMYNRVLQLLLVQHACFFALGVTIFNVSTLGLTPTRITRIGVLGTACVLEIIGQTGIIARAAHTLLSPLPAIVIWMMGLVILVAAIAWKDGVATRLGRGVRWLRFAGVATYPMYLVHNSIGTALMIYLLPAHGSWAVAEAIAVVVAASLLIALVPEPLGRRVLTRLWPRVDKGSDPVAHATTPDSVLGAGKIVHRV